MNRLEKKCFIASTGVHLLLGLILIVGPAFVSSTPKVDNPPILDFVTYTTTDEQMSGGGNPTAKPPPTATTAPQPIVQPQPQPRPQPPPPQPKAEPEELKSHEPERAKDPVKELKTTTDPDAFEPTKAQKRKPQVSVTPVKRQTVKRDSTETSDEDTRAREMADARRAAAASFVNRASRDLASGMSSSTAIELKGPGGGGVPYANFLAAVKTVYTDAWNIPDGVTDDDATVAASVTIARDGTVISERITHSSGNGEVDRSVQTTLDRVKFAARLPENAKEDQRTVTINFNVRAKRALG